ncbi:MAG: alpha/beta hydrolase-fold protein [Candidatus Sericytochromatia bacterium]|nr:alpha/beta hydrolase-fold protein [Candidatus Sericytochromatia bacterium]
MTGRRPKLLHGRLHRTRPYEIPGLPGRHPATIYLPPGYDHGTARYPVAYVFDGQNVFGDEGSFAGGWHLHHALDYRATAGRTVPIVVAVHHGEARAQELTPWPVEDHHEALGDQLLDWVVGRLAEMVAEDLRILKGPEHTLIGGSSLGGLLALYGFFRHPDVFGRALVMSPSLWVAEGKIFEFVAQARYAGDPRIYLDCGAREAEGIVIKHAEWMSDMLTRKGFAPGFHHLWRPDTHGAHNERHWARRLPRALRYLYDL